MKTRWLVYFSGIVTACAATEPIGDQADPAPHPLEAPDAMPADGGADADSSSCDDCEYFPEACSLDVLCSSGLFDPAPSGAGLDYRTTISAIRGRSRTDVWATGSGGALARFDGTSWTRVNLGIQETMKALWLRESSEISLAGFDRLYARGVDVPDGGVATVDGAWARYNPSYATGEEPNSNGDVFSTVWAARGAEWLWCGAQANTLYGSFGVGGLWRLRQRAAEPFEGESGISKASCVWPSCTDPAADAKVSSIHGWSANDLWAVGLSGVTLRISEAQGAAPSATTYNSQTLNALKGVWAASATEAWSVGAAGTIRRYTGDPLLWDIVPDVPTAVNLNAIWGSSNTDVWAVGDDSVVLHFDGTSWSRVKIAGLGQLRPQLTTVWVAESGHVWIGGHGVLLSLGGRP